MNDQELKRLIKIEEKLYEYAHDFGLDFHDIEWDIIPDQKMFEIMAYRIPGNISNWKYGRDYERIRTINENVYDGLPLEVVINSDPSRAYLMKSNTIGQQVLVMAHVIGHVAFFTMNKYFSETRKDMIQLLDHANHRFAKYEQNFGIDELEMIIDAGHALQLHSSPFDNDSEDVRKQRVFEMRKRKDHKINKSVFRDLLDVEDDDVVKMDINLYNQKLLRAIKQQTPIEPAADLLRYVIDHSTKLEDWQKDVLEILRQEGRYFWPQIQTKYMNEGFATYWHEKLVKKLWDDKLLNNDDMAQFNYSNSLVKAHHPQSMNPYAIGCTMWDDIVDRWDKGRHGREFDNCEDTQAKENWNTKDGKGHQKMFEVLRSYTDWFFMADFLTVDLVHDMNLYVYVVREGHHSIDLVRTKHDAQQIKDLIVGSFAHSQIPAINITNINYADSGVLYLRHEFSGAELQMKYATETLKHLVNVWGRPVILDTYVQKKHVLIRLDEKEKLEMHELPEQPSDPTRESQTSLMVPEMAPVTMSIRDLWTMKFPNLR
jgi:stage V sporulation protein R